MKPIAELNDENFDQAIGAANVPVVVDFFAPWCGPCIMLAPLLEQLALHFAGRIQFFKVNVEESPELATRFQISGVPMLAFMSGGEVRDVVVGFPPPQLLATKLQALTAVTPAEVRS
jgi:thioredoxin 1